MGGEMGVGDVADFVLAVGLDKVVLDVFQRVLRRVDVGGEGFDLVGLHLPVFQKQLGVGGLVAQAVAQQVGEHDDLAQDELAAGVGQDLAFADKVALGGDELPPEFAPFPPAVVAGVVAKAEK